jgi:hypothetical protein
MNHHTSLNIWVNTTKGDIRGDQIIAFAITEHYDQASYWRIELTCLNGLTFSGPALALTSDGVARFSTKAEADTHKLRLMGALAGAPLP